MKKIWSVAAVAVFLSACGGGGAGDSTTANADASREQAQSAAQQASLMATPASLELRLTSGQTAVGELALQYSGAAAPHTRLVIEGELPAVFAPKPVIESLGDGRFTVKLSTAEGLADGTYTGTLQFAGCHDPKCKNARRTARVAVPYSITVSAASDWQMHQGNAAHTGYVPVTLDPARFQYAWDWRRPASGVIGAINAVVSEGGKVFVTDDDYFSAVSIRALNEADGSPVWTRDFGTKPGLNPPAVANGVVYAATMGHSDTYLHAFRAADGQPVFQSAFDSQWGHVLAPTLADGRAYTNGGYYGGGIYSFDATSGSRLWSQTAGDDDMSTPAVDSRYVYHYSGLGLEVYGKVDGNLVASIPDPYGPGWGYSYHGSPILGSADNVIAFSGGAFSGRASSSVEQYDSRRLVNFSVENRNTRWISARAYLTTPALAKGVVYAGRNAPKSLDAISEATGEVLWSWAGTASDSEFHRNVVVTDNLLFVSTDRAVHAIDLATHQSVWSYPSPGMISLSASGMLYIVEGAREPTGRLIAIRVR
ncbi:MAG: PQQ-binding-like beta-propeller repeat protein [Rhizobacter sp.]|nr:PQQ-binding-like beta-propeller repeat protein [Rhizobacter sp.]